MRHNLPYCSLDLPEGWEDRSTYQFVSPPEGPDVPLAVGKGVEVSKGRVSVLVARVRISPAVETDDYLRQQMDELRKALPSLRVMSRAPWQHPSGRAIPAIDITFEVSPGLEVHQLQFYFRPGEIEACVCLTISCSAAQYASESGRIRQIFEGFVPAAS